MPALVREYREADFASCRALWAQLTQHHRDIYGDPTIGGDDPGAGWDAYLSESRPACVWVAEAAGQVVGLTGLLVHGEEAEIEPMIVASSHRRQGVGRALVERASAAARELGVRFLSVRPVARNAEAIAFFTGMGFGLLGHVDLFQDLRPEAGRTWKGGIAIHGHELRY